MKRLLLSAIIFLTTMAIQSQTTPNSKQTAANSSLTERQILLCACASLEAQGDMARLDPAIRKALDGGVTVNELKEAFSQLYAYTGFPRSLNALGTLQKVLSDRKAHNINDNEGKPFTRPALWDNAELALKQGTEVQTRLSGKPFNYDFCPQDDYYLKSHLFGDIFAGNQLSASDRELVTVAALSSLKGVEPQLAAHKAGAVNMGNSKEQVDALCQWLSDNGYSQVDNASDANAGQWPKGQPNTGYAQYFIGNSHLAPVAPANLPEGAQTVAQYVNVTFEPGCRNNWHVHHGAHQILICVAGRGWYQEWGKAPIALKPGMIIDIPAEVKHWHGAQRDSWFQHLTTHVATGGDVSNEWLEPVTDDIYNKL